MSLWKSAIHDLQKYGGKVNNALDVTDESEAVARAILHGAGAVAQTIVDNPWPKAGIGNLEYGMAKTPVLNTALDLFNAGVSHIPGQPDQPTSEDIRNAYEKGYNGRTGGRAVWELAQSDNPFYQRAIFDIGIDPTTYAGTGAVTRGAKAFTEAGALRMAAGETVKGRAIQETGKALEGVNRLYNAPNKATEFVTANVFGKVAKTRPGQWMTGLSKREEARKTLDSIYAAWKTSLPTRQTDRVAEVRGLNTARMAAKDSVRVVNESGGWLLRDAEGQPLNGIVYADRASAERDVPDILRSKGMFEKVGRRDDEIINYAWKAFSKARPVNPSMVGDRVFERGRFAGKDMTHVMGEAFSDASNAYQQAKRYGLIFTSKPTTKQINEEIKKLPEDMREPAREFLSSWTDRGIDPTTSSLGDYFKRLAKEYIDSDQTIDSLGDTANSLLFDETLKSGKIGMTYGQALKEWSQEFISEKSAMQQLVGKDAWKRDADPRFIRSVLTDKEEAIKLYKKWDKYGIDVLNDPADEAAFARFSSSFYADHGVFPEGRRGVLSDLAAVWKGQALMSPRYHMANVVSAWFNNIITGNMPEAGQGGIVQSMHAAGMATPRDFWDAIKHAVKADPDLFDTYGVDDLNKTVQDYGRGVDRNVLHMGLASFASNSREATQRIFRKIHAENFGAKLGTSFEYNRRVAAGIDSAARGRLYDTKLRAYVEKEIPAFEELVAESARKQGIDIPADLSLVPSRHARELLGYYRGLGFTDGMARRLSRDYANIVSRGEEEALAMVRKTHFSYYKTNLDETLGRVMPFHYYSSRATLLYTEAMMKNPVLLVNFARMMERLDGKYENSGLNGRQKGWIHVMSGPAGFTLLANPDALFGFTKTMGLMGDNYKSDQTKLGGILSFLKSGGFGLYPMIDSAFNMAGTYGNTFEPDFLGIRHRALIGSVINWIEAEAGMPPSPRQAFYAHINADLRSAASREIAKYTPGWMSSPVPSRNNGAGTIGQASIESLIETRILANNPDMTYEQLFQIMNDPESDAYQTAWQEVARSGVANQFLSFVAPIGLKFKESTGDVRSAALGITYDMARKYNIPASAVNPQTDAEFAAKYKAITGSDWKPGDFDRYQFESDLVNATPKGRLFIMQDAQYRALGTQRGRDALSMYQKIAHGEYVPPGFAKPQPGQEQDIADMWLYRQPRDVQAQVAEVQQLRESFRAANPDYGSFKDWQGKMSYLKTLLGGSLAYYREQVSKGNPNAARYFQNQVKTIREKYKTPAEQLDALDRATTSADAWMAINGTPVSVKEPAPLPTATSSAPSYTATDQMLSDYAPVDNQGPTNSLNDRLQRLGR